jgi:hypothetical protein
VVVELPGAGDVLGERRAVTELPDAAGAGLELAEIGLPDRVMPRRRPVEGLLACPRELASLGPIESRVEFEAGPAANDFGLRAVIRRHAPSATRQHTLWATGSTAGPVAYLGGAATPRAVLERPWPDGARCATVDGAARGCVARACGNSATVSSNTTVEQSPLTGGEKARPSPPPPSGSVRATAWRRAGTAARRTARPRPAPAGSRPQPRPRRSAPCAGERVAQPPLILPPALIAHAQAGHLACPAPHAG